MKRYDTISRSQMEVLIFEWVNGQHAERNRALLHRRLFDGITYEALAEEFDLSVSQVKRIITKGLATITRHMR